MKSFVFPDPIHCIKNFYYVLKIQNFKFCSIFGEKSCGNVSLRMVMVQFNFFQLEKINRRMFSAINETPQVEETQKKNINLVINGQPDKVAALSFKHQLKLSDIVNLLESKFHHVFKTIRIFNREGVQYEQEDLSYVKDNETLYISRGEEFDVNSCFSEYEFIKILGQGGFGRVELCKHKSTGELVAIKHMRADKVETAQGIDIIFRQTEHLKALSHPNIVKILNFYAPKGLDVVFVMEYMEGGELFELVKSKQRLSEQQAKMILRQIVSAISYCHFKNIVHRDLKLQNVLLTQKDALDIKVADFGISGVAEKVNPNVRSGTLRYMCPEVLSGQEKGNSPAVDVWAIGCILYYLVVGKHPFTASNTSEVIELIINGTYKIPADIGLSEEVTSLIKRMLDIDPKTRIRVPEIQDHSWLMKNRLFRFRNSRRFTLRKSRITQLAKRKSQIQQLFAAYNTPDQSSILEEKSQLSHRRSILERIPENSLRRGSKDSKSSLPKRGPVTRALGKEQVPPINLAVRKLKHSSYNSKFKV